MLTGLSQNNYKIITANYSRCSVWSKQELYEKKDVSFKTHKTKKRKKTDTLKTKQSLELMSNAKHTATKKYLLKDSCCICYLHIVMTITPERNKIKVCVSS